MNRRESQRLRAATIAAVTAFFDTLDAQSAVEPKRAVVRIPPTPSNDYTEIDEARANEIMQRRGLK